MRSILSIFFFIAFTFSAFAVEKMGPKATYAALNSGNLILIDIRRPDEWRTTGSAKGALRISMLSPDFVTRVKALQASNPNKKVALICQVGVRSARQSKNLEAQGLNGMVDVVGGTQLWIQQGLPITK
jgi:rhodanese-related sulfurtransferase